MDEECIYDKRLVGFNKKSYGKLNRNITDETRHLIIREN